MEAPSKCNRKTNFSKGERGVLLSKGGNKKHVRNLFEKKSAWHFVTANVNAVSSAERTNEELQNADVTLTKTHIHFMARHVFSKMD